MLGLSVIVNPPSLPSHIEALYGHGELKEAARWKWWRNNHWLLTSVQHASSFLHHKTSSSRPWLPSLNALRHRLLARLPFSLQETKHLFCLPSTTSIITAPCPNLRLYHLVTSPSIANICIPSLATYLWPFQRFSTLLSTFRPTLLWSVSNWLINFTALAPSLSVSELSCPR